MTTSPDELISQLRDFTSALTPDSSRRTLFTHPVPATQIHGTAPEDQAVLQSDFVLFQASISDQMNYMIESMAHMTELINANAAASSANAAASPATSAVASSTKSAPAAASTANFVATPAASTANVATAPAASTANSDAIPPTLSGAPKPSALLLAKMNFAITNPDLYENDGYHKMTTPSTVCERVKKLKPGVWSALNDTPGPGLEAELALTNLKFESMAIFPAMTDCDWAGEMVEALTLQPKSDRSRLVQSLLKVAVRCGTVVLIDDQIAQINATGLFDRKLASAGDLRLETNLQHFDPSTQGGKHLWEAIGRLITSYFSRCRSGEQGRQDAEHEYAELKCDSHESVSTFLCTEADCYDDLTRTGATYTGYTRIQLVLLKLPKMLQDAYERFKGRCKEIGQWKDSRSIDYDLFAADIELVAISMPLDTDEDKQGTILPMAPIAIDLLGPLYLRMRSVRILTASMAEQHQIIIAGDTNSPTRASGREIMALSANMTIWVILQPSNSKWLMRTVAAATTPDQKDALVRTAHSHTVRRMTRMQQRQIQ